MSIENLDRAVIEIIMESLDIESRINFIWALPVGIAEAFRVELRAYEIIIAIRMRNRLGVSRSMEYLEEFFLHEEIIDFSLLGELENLRANPEIGTMLLDAIASYINRELMDALAELSVYDSLNEVDERDVRQTRTARDLIRDRLFRNRHLDDDFFRREISLLEELDREEYIIEQ